MMIDMKTVKRGTVVRLKPSTLRRWVFFGTGMTTLIGAIVFLVFAQLQSTNGKWLWQDGFQLDGGQWFDAARTTVTLVGIIGLGGAAFLAYRRQVSTEATHLLEQSSGLRDRYTTCAEQLAHDSVAIRLAGVYALASLADDWHKYGNGNERQVCIDLLCAYLRTPATMTTATQQPSNTTRSTGRTLAGQRYLRPANPAQAVEVATDGSVQKTV